MKQVTAQKILSQNMLDEIKYVKENAAKVAAGNCPQVPVLCLLAKDKANLKRIPGWGKIHRDYFAGNQQAVFLELDCGHYLHREKPDEVVKAIETFINGRNG